MSKFKVGDRVRFTSGYDIWDNAPETLVVKHIHEGWLISLENNPKNGTSGYDETRLYVYPPYSFEKVEE